MTFASPDKHRQIMAILRGITPDDAAEVTSVLVERGITLIEVPLNSPQAVQSIAIMREVVGEGALIGAGTVLSLRDVDAVKASGGQFVVSPNFNAEVIAATKSYGLASYPGVMTPTECFGALNAGADALKLFPAFLLGTAGIKAMRAVLPPKAPLFAVGGVGPKDFQAYRDAGCIGFGMGTSLYKPGDSAESVALKACEMVAAYDSLQGEVQ